MRVAMLGPLSLLDGDRRVELGGARLRMLLVRLALDAGRVVPSTALIDGLWGVRPPSDATNALQSLVSRLRKAGMAGLLESYPVGYALAVRPEDVDVHAFERLAEAGRKHLRAGDATRAAEVLREALGLWRGPALVDVADAPFAPPAVARLAELRLDALEDRIDADIQRGRHAEVVVELSALVREHPLRERLAVLLVRALHLAGRQADALAAYETTRRALADELGVDPGPELREIHLAVLRSAPAEVPAGGSPLPAQLTTFVGRQHELAELRRTLGTGRLVTLVGPGGAGKTRLATEAVALLGDRVWFVHLASLREAVDVPVALATALGPGDARLPDTRAVWRTQPAAVTEHLVDVLAGRADVVVLDNCEHLVSAVADLADTLLARCPRLRILATSREPLAITGEVLLPLGPLPVPEQNATAAQAAGYAAVRLFTDRAGAVRPGFVVDEDTVGPVVAICRQLDGLPLALELAAARLRSMTVVQIADRLHDRFRLLTAGSRTSLPRHRTLGAVVEWSWSLLAEPERALAGRLSVFAGPASLDAVTAVCAGADLPADDVIYVLASLVEKSLVEAQEGEDGQPRYGMLQTVRAFAADRLADAEATRVRFCAYYLDLIETAEPLLRGADQLHWLRRLDAERDNTLAAIRVAVDRQDADSAVRIGAAWTWYWALRQGVYSNDLSEQVLPVKAVLALTGEAPADARTMLRMLATATEAVKPSPEELAELARLCRETSAMSRYPTLALMEPVTSVLVGDVPGAMRALRRALRHPEPWGRAAAMLGRALAAENAGHLGVSERSFRIALRGFTALGERWGMSMCHVGIAGIHSMRGEYTMAIDSFERARRLEVELGPLPDPPMLRAHTGEVRYRLGDLDGAIADLEAALPVSVEHAQHTVTVFIRCWLAMVLRAKGDVAAARAHVDAAVRVTAGQPAGPGDPMSTMVLSSELLQYVAEGDLAAAREVAARSIVSSRHEPLFDAPSIAAAGEALAVFAEADREPERAAHLLGASARVRGLLDEGSPLVRDLADRLVARLGPDAYREHLDRGRARTQQEAMDLLGVVLDEDP